MTAQAMERIFIDSKEHFMATEPLEQYLSSAVGVPIFYSLSTNCWRGYMGTWKIEDNKLYLIGLEGYVQTPKEKYEDVDMNYLFPNEKEVFAEWFSDEIRIPQGRLIQYVHMGYESVYEKDLLIDFMNGRVISKIKLSNL
jgi:hypothetical protein